MLTLDLKTRFRNKAFITAMVAAVVLLIQQLGFKNLIPSNYADIVNTVLTILTMLGIVIDTSTPGVSDSVNSTTSDQSKEVNEDSAANTDAAASGETEPDKDVVLKENEALKAQLAQIQAAFSPAAASTQV